MCRRDTYAAFGCLLIAGVLCSAIARTHPLTTSPPASSANQIGDPVPSEFVFARVQYTNSNGGRRLGDPHQPGGWQHSYPGAEEHILQLAREATGINVDERSHAIVRLDSGEVFRYPFLYFAEVGEMRMTPREAANLREYLNRGGFVMVDDFDGEESLDSFETQMRMVFPDRQIAELKADHPIFHTLYDFASLDLKRPYTHSGGGAPKFYGYKDDHGRLCMIVNHDNNLGAFWSMIDRPRYPLAPSTESVKLGLDYFLYSLTH